MRRLCLIALVFNLLGNQLYAQDAYPQPDEEDLLTVTRAVDSIEWLVKSKRVSIYPSGCQFPGHQKVYVVVRNLTFSEQVFSLSNRNRQDYIKTYALHMKASRLYEQKEYEGAFQIWETLLQLSCEKDFEFEEFHMYRKALNNLYFLAGNYAGAMRISSEGYQRAESLGDLSMMAHFSNVIGYIHMKQRHFPEAARYFLEDLHLSQKIRDTVSEAHALFNLGDLYLAKNSVDSAMMYLHNALELYQTAAHSPVKWFDLDERRGYISNKIAQGWILKKDFPRALSFIAVSLESAKKPVGVNLYDKAEYYIRASEIYNHLQQPDSAYSFARNGLDLARVIIHREHMMSAYEQLAIAFANKKKYDSAWAYQQLFNRLSDTINNESNKRDILLYEANLNIEKEKAQQEVMLERQRLWRNIILGLAVFMMIITYLLYNRYRLKQKNRLQAELNKQQLEILRTTIEVQDKERKRIAEDLHDGLGSILSAAKLKLSAVDGKVSEGIVESNYMEDTLSLLDEAINEMKNIAYNIMPATLSRLGLIAALQNLFNRISNRSGLKINFSRHGFEERIDPTLEVSLYRIVLESINNVVKHAKAEHVTVQLIKYPDYINITVEDDGIGFRQSLDIHGNGLANIDSRVRNLGGNMDIDSVEGRGTTILVDIPIS